MDSPTLKIVSLSLPEPLGSGIVVGLRNPPSGATKWLMNILDYAVSQYQSSGSLDISEPATFEVDQSWYPLRMEIHASNAEGAIIYHIQSFDPNGPNYQETLIIPDPGAYYYNMVEERFESTAPAAGFTVKITNPPEGAVLWNANFAENSFYYDPMADSGWLEIDETWEYPGDPLGCTTMRIWVLDANNNVLLDVYNLGPIENGDNYVFDCATAEEAVPSLVESMIMMMVVVMMMTMMMKSMGED